MPTEGVWEYQLQIIYNISYNIRNNQSSDCEYNFLRTCRTWYLRIGSRPKLAGSLYTLILLDCTYFINQKISKVWNIRKMSSNHLGAKVAHSRNNRYLGIDIGIYQTWTLSTQAPCNCVSSTMIKIRVYQIKHTMLRLFWNQSRVHSLGMPHNLISAADSSDRFCFVIIFEVILK